MPVTTDLVDIEQVFVYGQGSPEGVSRIPDWSE
jgi:hypothetical protein